MKKTYELPQTEIIILNVASDITETEFGIFSKEGPETLSKRANLVFDSEEDEEITKWDSDSFFKD